MDDAYSGYAYRRYKKPKSYFAVFFLVLFFGISFFVSNLMFGFVDFKREKQIILTAPTLTFSIDGTEYTTNARQVKIVNKNQTEIVEWLLGSFVKSYNLIETNPENARAMYNETLDKMYIFETWKKTAWSTDYDDLVKYLMLELFGLDEYSKDRIALGYYNFTNKIV